MSIDIPVDSLWMSGLICGGIGIILLFIYMILNIPSKIPVVSISLSLFIVYVT